VASASATTVARAASATSRMSSEATSRCSGAELPAVPSAGHGVSMLPVMPAGSSAAARSANDTLPTRRRSWARNTVKRSLGRGAQPCR
jgi:hypothetical protein